ncbi:MAG: hypothetical protein U0X75_20680 [Acidobacteriota bacterium]
MTSARSGSYVNYYLESVLVLAPLTGLGGIGGNGNPAPRPRGNAE